MDNKSCKFCNKSFKPRKSKQKFCSVSCGCKFNYNSKLKEHSQLGGLNSAKVQSKNRRSKNEIHFANLCIEYFNDVETNIQLFNGWDADVIIHDIKTSILWNGKWHYEKITKSHSVKQVQNRDKIKINEIIKFGYHPYIIKDMGKANKNFVIKEFNTFLEFIDR